MGQIQIGIRDLKAHLSDYLRRVQAGEQLTVTDRGRAIAVLAPVQRQASHDWAHGLVARGRAHWSGGKPVGLARRVPSRRKPASAMVIEDRR